MLPGIQVENSVELPSDLIYPLINRLWYLFLTVAALSRQEILSVMDDNRFGVTLEYIDLILSQVWIW